MLVLGADVPISLLTLGGMLITLPPPPPEPRGCWEEVVRKKVKRKEEGKRALRVQDLFCWQFNSFPPPRLPCELINNKSSHSPNSRDECTLGHTGVGWAAFHRGRFCLFVCFLKIPFRKVHNTANK